MFTGIVQGLGEIASINRKGEECRFCLKPRFEMKNIVNGESIAVNGACLSVEKHDASSFTVYASRETIERTNLGFLKTGALVNLERALAFGERLGGHLVSGHVDCLAAVEDIAPAGESVKYRLKFPREFGAEIIKKGSIALDGISLTINECGWDFLEVNIIPDSQKRTNISLWRKNTKVNMETDLIGKYVLRYASAYSEKISKAKPGGNIDLEFLAKNGFF